MGLMKRLGIDAVHYATDTFEDYLRQKSLDLYHRMLLETDPCPVLNFCDQETAFLSFTSNARVQTGLQEMILNMKLLILIQKFP